MHWPAMLTHGDIQHTHAEGGSRGGCKQSGWMYQEGLEWPVMPEAADSIRLLLLVHWPVPECHARGSIMAHLCRMVRALAGPADGIRTVSTPSLGDQLQGDHSRAHHEASRAARIPKAEYDGQSPVPTKANCGDTGICSPDGVPPALDYSVNFESMDIDLLSPLTQPAGHSLCSGELCEEGYKRMADAARAAGTVFRPSLAASLQEGQPIDGVAVEIQAGAAAQSMLCSLW